MTQVVAQLEVALEQQDRQESTIKVQFWPLNVLWNRVALSGSKENHHNKVEENALEYKLTFDMPSNVMTAVPIPKELRNEHDANMQSTVVPAIPLEKMKEITNNFSSKGLITHGSRGSLYHGVLRSGQDVAVKKFKRNLSEQNFIEEVSTISSLEHENVVRLFGYCVDDGLQALVYEFAPRGSLHDILHGRQGIKCTLSWAQRIEIAIRAARGLLYVHEKALIHRNIRSNNVLLFDDEIAKITDLRLVNKCPRYEDRVIILPCRDCLFPECLIEGHSQESDVYTFGVVLLELLTGCNPFDHAQGPGPQYLVTWAEPRLKKDKVMNIVDPRLKGDYPPRAAAKMGALVEMCTAYKARYRPNMSSVVKALESIDEERTLTTLPDDDDEGK